MLFNVNLYQKYHFTIFTFTLASWSNLLKRWKHEKCFQPSNQSNSNSRDSLHLRGSISAYKIEYQDRAITSLFELLQELQQRANQAMVASSLLKWGPIFH